MLVQSLAMNLGTSSVQEIVFGKYRVSDGVIPIWPIQVKLETARVQVFNYPSFNSFSLRPIMIMLCTSFCPWVTLIRVELGSSLAAARGCMHVWERSLLQILG